MSKSRIDLTVSKDQSRLAHPSAELLNRLQWSYVKKRYHMTPREIQIARLVCQGLGNEEIASKLKIKLGTVKTHIRNLYRKLWVHNKISMLLRFVEDTKGLLDKSAV